MLEFHAVEYRYPNGVVAVDGVEFRVSAGELHALVGANGSGKTTLLRLAAAMLEPTAGRVLLFGQAWSSPQRLASRIAWIDQDPGLDPTMTGAEHLDIQAALMGLARSRRAKRIAELVGGLRLDGAVDHFVAEYSGGMRQRLHLALGLLHDPELLLLDEPTAGLDPEGQAAVWRFLVECAKRGRALLVVTHDLGRVAEHATTVIFVDHGKIVGAGTPAELAADHATDLLGAYTALSGRDGRLLIDPSTTAPDDHDSRGYTHG